MQVYHWILLLLIPAVALPAAGHALLYKRDPRSSWGWIAVILLSPFLGALLYFLFGINRVKSRGQKLLENMPFSLGDGCPLRDGCEPIKEARIPPELHESLVPQGWLAYALTGRPLASGNAIVPLHNGEEAYPAMLDAIDNAAESVSLAVYIFDPDEVGMRFIDALERAHKRGCDVKVVIDGIGGFKLFTQSAHTLLRERGVDCRLFLQPSLFPPSVNINLRCHHKNLVVDRKIGFTGGMNISARHLYETNHPDRQKDMLFRLEGPVISHMDEVFYWLWGFVTGKDTEPPPELPQKDGPVHCRMIADGPNEDLDKLHAVLVSAVHGARERVTIVTPYFLPPRDLLMALRIADTRGVDVRIVIPEENNQWWIHRATRNMLWELLEFGVEVYMQKPPFAHTKLFVVDGEYACVGSANVDARSLRLNFELNLEVYDGKFTRSIEEYAENLIANGKRVTLHDIESRSFATRLLDSLCWLLSPYL